MSKDVFGMDGKVALVMGGGAGMGRSTAIRLAEAGCAVAVLDCDSGKADAVAAELRGLGARATPLTADATDAAAVEQAVGDAAAALGPVDLMVSVIGVGVWASLAEMTVEQWDEAFRMNLATFFLPAQAVARRMIAEGRGGALLCVASVSGLTSAPGHASYGAAKAGLVNLVRTMAVEWGPHDIRVNAIAPGSIITPRISPSGEAAARLNQRLPMGRLGTTDEIAKAALFLLSDLASYVTGHTLPVDGGWMSAFLMRDANPGATG